MADRTATRRRSLARNALLVLDDARGLTVGVEAGTLWITLENDARDVVLLPGQRFCIDRPGRTVVMANTPATVRLTRTPRYAGLRRMGATLWGAVVRTFTAARPRMLPYF